MGRSAELFHGILKDSPVWLAVAHFLRGIGAVDQMQYSDSLSFGSLIFGFPIGDYSNSISMIP